MGIAWGDILGTLSRWEGAIEGAIDRAFGLSTNSPTLTQPIPASLPGSTSSAPGSSPIAALAPSAGSDDPIVGPAFSWLSTWTPADRRALLDVETAVGLDPRAGALLAVIDHESGGKASALNPLPAAGLIQLTRGANLPGYTTAEAVRAVASMTPAEQLRSVVLPFYQRAFPAGAPKGMDGVALLRRNFLPALASKPADYVLGVREGAWGPAGESPSDAISGGLTRGAIYASNRGFDSTGRGYFTWEDVDRQSRASVARGASRGLMTVSGKVVSASAGGDAPLAGVPGKADLATGLLLPAAQAGVYQPITWVDVPGPDGMTITVAADDLRADAGGSSLRLPVSWPDTIAIARALSNALGFGIIAPSKRIADAIYAAAPVKTVFHSLVTPNDPASGGWKMHTLDFSRKYNADVDAQIAAAGQPAGTLVAGADKYWILHPWLVRTVAATKRPAAVNYGAWDAGGRPLQSPGARHDVDYPGDYSQLFRPIKRWAKGADGSPVDLIQWTQAAEGVPARFAELFDFGGEA